MCFPIEEAMSLAYGVAIPENTVIRTTFVFRSKDCDRNR